MSASPKPPSAPGASPGPPRRPSAPRAAPLFELGAPAAAPLSRPSGPRPAPIPLQRPTPARAPAPAPAPAARSARKKRRGSAWPFYAAMGLILLALPAGYFLLLPDTPTPVQEPVVQGKPVEIKVTRIDGAVEIRHAASGAWGQVKLGDTLQPSDGVRTTEGSAVLSGGDQYEVQLQPHTEVAVDELTDSISRVMLGNGMATARVQGGGKHTFEVHARNSDAVARTRQGTFAISNNMEGTVAVGTKDGEVEFAGRGKTVIVRAGQQSVVRPGQAPSDPTTLPSELLLKVDWPGGRILTRAEVTLSGQATPGALVIVQGQRAVVDSNGIFRVRIKLKEGKTTLKVTEIGVNGLRREAEQEVRIDTRAPNVTLDSLPWSNPH